MHVSRLQRAVWAEKRPRFSTARRRQHGRLCHGPAAARAAANPVAADPLPDWNVLTPALADFNSFSVTRALPPLIQPGTPKVSFVRVFLALFDFKPILLQLRLE